MIYCITTLYMVQGSTFLSGRETVLTIIVIFVYVFLTNIVLFVYVFPVHKIKSNILSLTVVKRKDIIKGIVKVPLLDLTITASQRGVLTVFNKQVILNQIILLFH